MHLVDEMGHLISCKSLCKESDTYAISSILCPLDVFKRIYTHFPALADKDVLGVDRPCGLRHNLSVVIEEADGSLGWPLRHRDKSDPLKRAAHLASLIIVNPLLKKSREKITIDDRVRLGISYYNLPIPLKRDCG